MKFFRWFLLFIVVVFFASCGNKHRSNLALYEELKAGFKNPQGTARPKVYWWWLNGHVDTVRLKEELRAMKKVGLGGADIFEIGVPDYENKNMEIPSGPAFMGPEFMHTLKAVIDEAAELDLELGLNLASSWNAGGSWTLPEHAAKTVYVSKMEVTEGMQIIRLPFPLIPELDPRGRRRVIQYGVDGKPVYRKEIAVLALSKKTAIRDTTQIINISSFFDAERDLLRWKAPHGEWEIHRYVCANSGEQLFMPSASSIGPIIDHYDPAATSAHLQYFIDKLRPIVKDFRTSPIKYFYLASYEAKDFAWTASLPVTFKKETGYDVAKYLPFLFDETLFDKETVDRFRYDLRMVMSELMINNHYRKAKEITNREGLKIASEAGGPGVYTIPVETLKALGSLDIPRGEFWHKTARFDKDSVDIIWLVKEIAAASHIYKRGIVEEEAFTSFSNDWQEGPADLKPLADRAFCEGMNRLVIHGFTHNVDRNGFPGIGYFAGTHFNPKSGWWAKSKPFVEYLSRISYILQQTDFVSDVLYYYGDDVPNLVPPKNTRFKVEDGYDYEIVNKEILLKELIVKDNKLVLPGVGTYHALCIGQSEACSLEVLEKLKQLSEQGAVIIGAKSSKAAGLNRTDEPKIKALADKLWNESEEVSFDGKGKIYSATSPLKTLQTMNIVPDFSYEDQSRNPLDYIHYRKGDLDFYLIRNTTDRQVARNCFFRQQGKAPEIWDPITGDISKALVYHQDEQRIGMPISLPPQGTLFICFKPSQLKPIFRSLPDSLPSFEYVKHQLYLADKPIFVQELKYPWKLTFPKGWGAPDSVILTELQSWTDSDIAGIRYFSGTAVYDTEFEFSGGEQGARVVLQLGNVSKVAEVWLNNSLIGIAWAKPYCLDITDHIRKGNNTLHVEVSNNWANRLIGDALTGEKYTSTNIKLPVGGRKLGWDRVPLTESGLIGPVSVMVLRAANEELK